MRSWLALGLVLALVGEVLAASPTLDVILPRGGQRGTEVEFLFSGARLKDAQEILFYTPGLTVTKLDIVNDNQCKAKIKIAPDCQLGRHLMRVRTASGLTDLRTIHIGALPEINEVEPNNDFTKPQKINLNCTINGIAEFEDVDFFSVDCKKGQRLSVEVEGMRLGRTVFDPYIAVLNSKRFEIAASDDHPLGAQDGAISVIIPEDGTYIVQVRETNYSGNGACNYRLHVGNFPRPTACIPAGGKLGEEVEVTFLGDATGPFKQKIKLPTVMIESFGLFVQDASGVSPTPLPFRLSANLSNAFETAGNLDVSKATPFDPKTQAINGLISQAGENDHYKFTAKKGEAYDVHCYGRRIRSPIDSVMHMYLIKDGKVVRYLQGDDDAARPDCYFRFTAPEDGEYSLMLHDHLKKGGPTFTYRVEFTPPSASVSFTVPKVDGNNQQNQERQSFAVPKGNRMAYLINSRRVNMGGDLALTAKDLPKGMTMDADIVSGSVDLTPVVLSSAADAPIAGNLSELTGKLTDPKNPIEGRFNLQTDLVYVQNQGGYIQTFTNKPAAAVTQEVPFKVTVVEPKTPLVQNGAMNLKVVVERKEGFKNPVNVYMLWNPPGMGSASIVTIPGDKNEGYYYINAAPNAGVRKWKTAMIAQADVGFGPAWVSTQLFTIEIAAPYLTMAMDRAAVEQGKETEILCKFTQAKPFTGNAKVKIVGLPHNATAPEVDITKDTKEIAIKVTTKGDSPPGQHQGVFCQVTVPDQGESVLHNLGGTVLRIDPPPKVAAAAPATPAKTAPATPAKTAPTEKKLTRLEKLRQEQEEKEKAAAKPGGN